MLRTPLAALVATIVCKACPSVITVDGHTDELSPGTYSICLASKRDILGKTLGWSLQMAVWSLQKAPERLGKAPTSNLPATAVLMFASNVRPSPIAYQAESLS